MSSIGDETNCQRRLTTPSIGGKTQLSFMDTGINFRDSDQNRFETINFHDIDFSSINNTLFKKKFNWWCLPLYLTVASKQWGLQMQHVDLTVALRQAAAFASVP